MSLRMPEMVRIFTISEAMIVKHASRWRSRVARWLSQVSGRNAVDQFADAFDQILHVRVQPEIGIPQFVLGIAQIFDRFINPFVLFPILRD